MKVAIVILHYKNIKDTLECLRSIEKLDRKGLEIETIVVNNSLQKLHLGGAPASWRGHPVPTYVGTSEVVIPLFIIHNKKNLGFAAGVNVGIRKTLKDKKTEYVLILNNDTILPRNLLTVLLKNEADIVSPVIKFKWNNSWLYDYGGRVNWWTGRTKHLESANYPINTNKSINNEAMKPFDFVYTERLVLSVVEGSRSAQGKQSSNLAVGQVTINNQQLTISDIDYVSGCCMLVAREVFEKIGLFDEDYFFYFEDVDFCTRAKRAGFRVKVNPNIAVFHKLGGSIGRWTKEAILRNLWGNFLFIKKNLGWRKPVGFAYLFLLTGKIIFNYLRGRQ